MGFFTKFFLLPSSASLVIPVSVVTTNTNLSNELVLATYQSYILDSIADEAYNDYNLKTIYFENDKEVFNGFASGAFDLAVLSSSTLEEAIDKGLVKRINWSRFNGSVKTQLSGISNDTENNDSHVANKLGELYSPVIKEFFTKNNKLATHGVPYFLSYLAFAYRGKKELGSSTSEKSTSSNNEMKPMGWKELIKKITEDKRFKTEDDRPRLGMVEDELTLFSLSKLSSQEGGVEGITNLFKDKENKKSEKEFFDSFMNINNAGIKKGDQMGSRPVFFSPDSVVLSDALNDGTLNGVFFYNGDALYAHTLTQEDAEDEGEEAEEDEEESDSDSESSSDENKQIHIVPLNPALWLLDSIAISAKASEEKLETIYKFLEKISFGDLGKLSKLKVQETLEADEEEEEEEEVSQEETENKKAGWLINNYKEILYTPTLKNFNKWIKGKLQQSSTDGGGEEFYKKEKEFLYGNPDIEDCLEKQTQARAKRSPESQQCNISIVFERGLTESQNLNLTMAFERWKNGF